MYNGATSLRHHYSLTRCRQKPTLIINRCRFFLLPTNEGGGVIFGGRGPGKGGTEREREKKKKARSPCPPMTQL